MAKYEILARERGIVTGIFCINGRDRRGKGIEVYRIPRTPGFRSSEA
jgi:hypothetical protein